MKKQINVGYDHTDYNANRNYLLTPIKNVDFIRVIGLLNPADKLKQIYLESI